MIKSALTFVFIFFTMLSNGQESEFQLYQPDADAGKQLAEAIEQANAADKHVFVQIGGNWCRWCRMFYKWSIETPSVDSLFNTDYIVVHLNYSKENKNEDILETMEFPQRFGFPVFVILDGQGKKLHTQSTVYLEEGEGYSEQRVTEFLKQWNKQALSAESYKEKQE